ncbi:MAG: hypothetical protein ACRY3E_02195 [Candidatus Lariskella arthropodorum]
MVGCDANSHHTTCSSTNNNRRGDDLLSYILSQNIVITNGDNKPSFINSVRQEVYRYYIGELWYLQ